MKFDELNKLYEPIGIITEGIQIKKGGKTNFLQQKKDAVDDLGMYQRKVEKFKYMEDNLSKADQKAMEFKTWFLEQGFIVESVEYRLIDPQGAEVAYEYNVRSDGGKVDKAFLEDYYNELKSKGYTYGHTGRKQFVVIIPV